MSKISGFRASNWSREVLGGVPEAYLLDHRRCFPLSLDITVLARCRRRHISMIRGPTASTDARIASASPFYPGVQLEHTSMGPILAMLRSSGLPCFYVGGCGGAGLDALSTHAQHALLLGTGRRAARRQRSFVQRGTKQGKVDSDRPFCISNESAAAAQHGQSFRSYSLGLIGSWLSADQQADGPVAARNPRC